MHRPHADVTFTAIVLVIAVLALAFGGWLIAEPPIPLGRDILAMSPRVFPTLILIATAFVSFLFLAKAYRDGTLVMDEVEIVARNRVAIYRQALFVVITVGCAMLLTTLGFLTTMFLLMAGTAVLVGNRSVWQIVSISLVVPLVFYVLVTHVLRTELPEADVIERTLQPLMQLLPTV